MFKAKQKSQPEPGPKPHVLQVSCRLLVVIMDSSLTEEVFTSIPVRPDFIWHAGAGYEENGKHYERPHTTWGVDSSRVEGYSLDEHILHVAQRLEPARDALKFFIRDERFQVNCLLTSDYEANIPGFVVPSSTLGRLDGLCRSVLLMPAL